MKSALRIVVISGVALAGVAWMILGLLTPIDYWDGMNFVLQSRRLTDPQFSAIPFDAWRPRGLVALLSGFDWVTSHLTHSFPSVAQYHVFMALLTVAFLAVWNVTNSRLWGRTPAFLATLFLLATDLVHHYAASLLADVTTSLYWGLALLVFVYRAEEEFPRGRAILFGALGAFCGLSKFHFLLLLPMTVMIWAAADWKKRARALGWALLGYFLALEAGLRWLSGNETGILGQGRSLLEQVKVVTRLHRPVELYFEGLFWMYGPIFWMLILVGIINSRRTLILPARSRAVLTGALGLAILTQIISQREIRYLVPLLPLFLGWVAAVMVQCLRQWPAAARIAWMGLWGIALLYPVMRSYRDLRMSFTGTFYQNARQESDVYWAYFGLPSLKGNRCGKIEACLFSLKSPDWEYPKDEYYRSYDLGPHYEFFTRLPVSLHSCGLNQRLEKLTSEDTCYVLPYQDAKESSPYLAVIKPLGTGWTWNQKKLLLSLSAHPREGTHCEQERCWSVAPFFRASPREY